MRNTLLTLALLTTVPFAAQAACERPVCLTDPESLVFSKLIDFDDVMASLGLGSRVYPKVEAVGEGAIAVLFERDQPALAFDIAGGEQGYASIKFINRQGEEIDTVTFSPLTEASYGFARQKMEPDIAGFILLNTDPQGISVDNLRFEGFDLMG